MPAIWRAVERAAGMQRQQHRGAGLLLLAEEAVLVRQRQVHARRLHRGQRADRARQLAFEAALEGEALLARVQKDPEVALCVDVGDFDNGDIKQICVYGAVEITDYDVELVRRMLRRYLGDDEASWSDSPDDYRAYLKEGGPAGEGAVLLKLEPRKMVGMDFTYASKR